MWFIPFVDKQVGVQVKLCDSLTTRAILECIFEEVHFDHKEALYQGTYRRATSAKVAHRITNQRATRWHLMTAQSNGTITKRSEELAHVIPDESSVCGSELVI